MSPEQFAALTASFDRISPAGVSHTFEAWQQALDELHSFTAPSCFYEGASQHVVLVTDGAWTAEQPAADGALGLNRTLSLDEYDARIESIADQSRAVGIATAVVGVPGSEDPQGALYDPLFQLTKLAIAGMTALDVCSASAGTVMECYDATNERESSCLQTRGSYCHLDATGDIDVAASLLQMFSAIAAGGPSCEFVFPRPPPDQQIDPARTVITRVVGDTRTELVQSHDDCATGDWMLHTFHNGDPGLIYCDSVCKRPDACDQYDEFAYMCQALR
jgi:hypothetical protein